MIYHSRTPKRLTLVTTPYTDQNGHLMDESATSLPQTEKDIEKRGLVVGRRTKISNLRETVSRHRLCICSLIGIVCLFYLSHSYPYKTHILNTNTKTAEAVPIIPVAPTKQPNDSPTWTFAGYSDEQCKTSIVDDKGTESIQCKSSEDEISKIDFDGQQLYTLSLYQGLDCKTLVQSYPNAKYGCEAGFNTTSYKVVLNKKVAPGKCDPDACKQKGPKCNCDPLGVKCLC